MQELQCKQCGTCCRKGGPLLHKADVALVQQGHVALQHITTLRAGELAYDPIYQKLIPLEEEALKINGTQEQAHPWHCIYHCQEGCGLHPLRPVQCEALFCQDTSSLESMYHEERACRADILPPQEGWLSLAEAHEEQCALRPLINMGHELYFYENSVDEHAATQEILHSIRYDVAFRHLCTENGHIQAELLPCILGRPLHIFMHSLGFAVQTKTDGTLTLKKLTKAPYFT